LILNQEEKKLVCRSGGTAYILRKGKEKEEAQDLLTKKSGGTKRQAKGRATLTKALWLRKTVKLKAMRAVS